MVHTIGVLSLGLVIAVGAGDVRGEDAPARRSSVKGAEPTAKDTKPVETRKDHLDPVLVKSAAEKGLSLLYQAGNNWQNNKSCFSCHHQTLPMLSIVEAGVTGFKVDREWLKSQADHTYDYFRARVDRMNTGRHVEGGASTLSFGLWSLLLDNRPPDAVTTAMVNYLLATQGRPWMDTRRPSEMDKKPSRVVAKVEGLWLTNCVRPPLSESRIGTTVLSLVGLKHYADQTQRAEVETAAKAAEAWMAKAPLRTTEDRFWRLWGLQHLGGDAAAKKSVREAIVAAQRADGGWAQDKDMESDAYATGQMLYILLQTGSLPDDSVSRRAGAFLLRTQHPDGSWFVKSRVKGKAQPYFDNGDPYGKDQFIAVSATSWATAALIGLSKPKPAATGTKR